jgi:hypothetical protein
MLVEGRRESAAQASIAAKAVVSADGDEFGARTRPRDCLITAW